MATRDVLELIPSAGDAEVGVWLAAMDEARGRTLEELEDLTPHELESRPAGAENTIATILYHLALIEADWLVNEILQWGDATATLGEILPFDARDLEGRLTEIHAMSLREHLDRLAAVRALLHTHLDAMRADDFHRLRSCPDYDVSPAWVLHHLLQHEAEHRSQIAWTRDRLRS